MDKFIFILRIIFSLPKTIIFNFRTFKFSNAIKLPVYVDLNVKVLKTYKNAIVLKQKKIRMFGVKIGIGGSKAINSRRGLLYLNKKNNAKLFFSGDAKFSSGIVIFNNHGCTYFGNNFSSNKNCFISSDSKIVFGDDVLLGWDINIRDSDGHKIYYSNKKNTNNDVIIGNHVWVCSYVDILKGTFIGNDCVVGYRSLVTGIKTEDNCLIAGSPAKCIKNNIKWEK